MKNLMPCGFWKIYSNFSLYSCNVGSLFIWSCSKNIMLCMFWLLKIENEAYYLINAVWQVKCLETQDSREVHEGLGRKMGSTIWHSQSGMKSNDGRPMFFSFFLLVAAGVPVSPLAFCCHFLSQMLISH